MNNRYRAKVEVYDNHVLVNLTKLNGEDRHSPSFQHYLDIPIKDHCLDLSKAVYAVTRDAVASGKSLMSILEKMEVETIPFITYAVGGKLGRLPRCKTVSFDADDGRKFETTGKDSVILAGRNSGRKGNSISPPHSLYR